LGQTQPVKAIFSVYSTAMEATALALMGKKMKAAQLVYGDELEAQLCPKRKEISSHNWRGMCWMGQSSLTCRLCSLMTCR
jgi:hypothetical protein